MDKPIEEAGDGHRHIIHYQKLKYYFVVTDRSFDIAGTSEKIEERTKVGFGIINRLATRLLEDGIDMEDLASLFWSECRSERDLAGMVTTAIEQEIKNNGK